MNRGSGSRTNSLGFTLIEAVVACLIMAILGAVAMAGFSTWLPRYRLKAAARDLYAYMQATKMTAIKNNAKCSISYSKTPDRYFVSGVTTSVNLRDYGSGVKFQGPQGQSYSVATITFNSRGTCNPGYAYLTDEKNSAYYRIGPWTTGVIRFEQYVSGSWE